MRLKSLRLQNFRQHVDTRIKFENGLTGIIGPNGAGKSTLLEAIAWALYGNSAARGTRDSIRFSRAAPRASVRVELEFELAGHSYRIIRGITTAECFLDGGDEPIANTITGVSELMQRRLGMTRTEFFHTYFTGQKEIDVMSTLALQTGHGFFLAFSATIASAAHRSLFAIVDVHSRQRLMVSSRAYRMRTKLAGG